MKWLDELFAQLPTPTARWVAAATATIAPASFAIPFFLKPLWPESTPAQIVPWQILLPTLIALLGSWIILFLVLREFHKPKTKKIAPYKSLAPLGIDTNPKPLDKEKERLLDLLFQFPGKPTEAISRATKQASELVLYHLEELLNAGLVRDTWNPGGRCWQLEQSGRHYLIKNGIVKAPDA